jgi:selenocysteine-specific translation elongation factor
VQNVYKYVPKAKKTIKKAKQQPKKRRHTLTDAQKKQKREIMEILLEKEVTEPAPVKRPPTAAQYNADIQIKRGNVVVVNNPVDKNEDLSGFQPVLTRKEVLRQHKAEKQAKEEALLDDMNCTLNVLLEEPNRRISQQKHYHQIQKNKAAASSKHIHVVQSQSRAKLAS